MRKPNAEPKPKYMAGTVKYGSSLILVWGYMAASGAGKLVFSNETVEKYLYLNILKTRFE